ncbi:MAG: cell division protein SepF [Cyanobacteriota bacterium]
MDDLTGYGMPEVMVIIPSCFEEAMEAVLAVRARKVVLLQADQLDPEVAQRAIDFVAGGVTAMDGQAERLDATTFLFAPALVNLSHL